MTDVLTVPAAGKSAIELYEWELKAADQFLSELQKAKYVTYHIDPVAGKKRSVVFVVMGLKAGAVERVTQWLFNSSYRYQDPTPITCCELPNPVLASIGRTFDEAGEVKINFSLLWNPSL